VLDQKLIRENPTSVEESLSLRGKVFNISQIQELTLQKKEIDIEISSLQSESKKLSKLIGQEISKSKNKIFPYICGISIFVKTCSQTNWITKIYSTYVLS